MMKLTFDRPLFKIEDGRLIFFGKKRLLPHSFEDKIKEPGLRIEHTKFGSVFVGRDGKDYLAFTDAGLVCKNISRKSDIDTLKASLIGWVES